MQKQTTINDTLSVTPPFIANGFFSRIETELRKLGYDINRKSDYRTIHYINSSMPKLEQEYKINSFTTFDNRVFYLKEDAPLLTVRLTRYKDEFGKVIYNLGANISSGIYDWEGEDDKLYILRDIFIDDAASDIIAGYASLGEIKEEKIDNILRKATDRIYEGLYKQIKEGADEDISIEDINMKIDIIMDALGLESEEKDENKNTEEIENTIDISDTEEEDNNDSDEQIEINNLRLTNDTTEEETEQNEEGEE